MSEPIGILALLTAAFVFGFFWREFTDRADAVAADYLKFSQSYQSAPEWFEDDEEGWDEMAVPSTLDFGETMTVVKIKNEPGKTGEVVSEIVDLLRERELVSSIGVERIDGLLEEVDYDE